MLVFVVVPNVLATQWNLLLEVFAANYQYYARNHQTPGIASLHYICVAFAFTLSGHLVDALTNWVYRRLRQQNGSICVSGFKLPLLLLAGILIPIGIIIYGWAMQHQPHCFALVTSIFILATGSRVGHLLCPLYLADALTVYTAAMSSALVMTRGICFFTLPLFVLILCI